MRHAARADCRMPDNSALSTDGTDSAAPMQLVPDRRDNTPERDRLRRCRPRAERVPCCPELSYSGIGDSNNGYDRDDDQVDDRDTEHGAYADPNPFLRILCSLHGAFHIALSPIGIDLRGLDDGDDTERQTAEKGAQNGPSQIVVRFFDSRIHPDCVFVPSAPG